MDTEELKRLDAKKAEELQRYVDEAERIVFFGGAGVSTESGIPDFRSEDGLYRTKYSYPPEEILSHGFFMNNPREFYRFYFDKMIYTDARPNAAHLKLAELERVGKLSAVVTQNIDGLHQMAGSEKVYELHGSVLRYHCERCGSFYGLNGVFEKFKQSGLPTCECGGVIKPDVTLYGETLDGKTLEGAIRQIERADVMIVGGTSLNVYPAAGLIDYFRGSRLVIINKSLTPYDGRAGLRINAKIGEVFGKIKC